MEEVRQKGFLKRDNKGNVEVDESGFLTFFSDHGLEFQVPSEDIDFTYDMVRCTVNGVEIDVALTMEKPTNMEVDDVEPNNADNKISLAPETSAFRTTIENNAAFTWTDATTKLFLTLYKDTKDLVTTRKLKTYKVMWEKISEQMIEAGHNVTPVQVQNKFKTMERAYKNMVSQNKKTGRGRTTCSFESELTELLGKKHSIAPLAISGRKGTVVRKQSENFSEAAPFQFEPIPSTSTGRVASGAMDSTNFTTTSPTNFTTTSPTNFTTTSTTNFTTTNTTSLPKKGTTANAVSKLQIAIEEITAEIKEQGRKRDDVQVQLLHEHSRIAKKQEDFINASEAQWAFANAQREEKNSLLRELVQLLKKSDESEK